MSHDVCRGTLIVINNGIDSLRTQLRKSLQHINEDSRAYEIIFNVLHYGVTERDFVTQRLSVNPRFVEVLEVARKFLDSIYDMYDKLRDCAPDIASDVFNDVLTQLGHAKKPKYFVFCDGMSIREALYLADRLGAKSIKTIINPAGVTETYKFILGAREYVTKQPNLDEVIRRIAEGAGAQYIIFREYDEAIHQIEGSEGLDPRSIVEKMYSITQKLELKMRSLKREGATITLLSDHGYDVVSVGSGKFRTQHRWNLRSLSILAPVMVVDPLLT
ncbi:MAG: hypothetical protein L7H04_03330 [Vulcanisaeta sp.]|nr:hypothetical protein [Vulcanisaeta sp.]